ncbi:hypothetical protein [Burkholderia latens]|uniref:hypothetical protein n=1 Tax=Burkholderia latens TaxID=488446 RepID=UPI001ABAB48F|nr:hypothetical protein [Burkholderia latens]
MQLIPTRQYPELPLLEHAVVARTALTRAKRSTNLLEDAKHRAKQIVRQAAAEADACRAHAYSEGYEAGLAQAAAIAARFFGECEELKAKMYGEVVDAVQQTIAAHLNEPEWLLRVTAAFTAQRDAYRPMTMRIALPTWAKAIAPDLRRQLAQAGVATELSYVDTRSFVIEWGDEIVEFDAPVVARSVCSTALRDRRSERTTPGADIARRFLETVLHELDGASFMPEHKE